jgi:hypothetical protein
MSNKISAGYEGPLPLMIAIEDTEYRIWGKAYKRSGNENNIYEKWTADLLQPFKILENKVKELKSIQLEPDFCQQQLRKMAYCGHVAYNWFFRNEEAGKQIKYLVGRCDNAMHFMSDATIFPWELLYDSEDEEREDSMGFWGFRYTIARDLKGINGGPLSYPHSFSSVNMLFCLHRKLWYAHQHECTDIERLVTRKDQQGFFNLLSSTCSLGFSNNYISAGESLARYLQKSKHNMLHFACHCKQRVNGDDVLVLTLLDQEMQENGDSIKEFYLEREHFISVGKSLSEQPFIFLNACQSAGVPDDRGQIFNFPRIFVEYGAGAVIATICPVPDLFAAAFAKEFYKRFLISGKLIGKALQETRWHFLKKYHNPLGLAYGLYTPAEYHMVQPRPVGGFVR